MAQTKKVDPAQWPEHLRMLSNGNKGRLVAIEVADMSVGDQPLTSSAPLFAMDYDPAEKGDDLVITVGKDEIDYSHTIKGPVELWESQDDNGKLVALEVVDQEGTKTIVAFK
jgi:hypothetical protein